MIGARDAAGHLRTHGRKVFIVLGHVSKRIKVLEVLKMKQGDIVKYISNGRIMTVENGDSETRQRDIIDAFCTSPCGKPQKGSFDRNKLAPFVEFVQLPDDELAVAELSDLISFGRT